MEFRFRNVNDAFSSMVGMIHNDDYHLCEEDSRNGPVMSFEDPVTITYNQPLERVLFNPGRDCNPFFHLVEALWMLAGRNDIAIPAYFNSQMLAYSDDGKTQHAAYGHRWRHHFKLPPDEQLQKLQTNYTGYDHYNSFDQLDSIILQLRKDPTTRRLCLAMWDPASDLFRLQTGESCKDLPCNTHCYFRVSEGKYLNLTVCNRSNDMIWGTFGANLVHMSFLLEYIALSAGLQVGVYHQITNNLHTYKDKWKPKFWLRNCVDAYQHEEVTCDDVPLLCPQDGGSLHMDHAGEIKAVFDAEVIELMELLHAVATNTPTEAFSGVIRSPFLQYVAWPMTQAFIAHKRSRNYSAAQLHMAQVKSSDWRKAGREWLLKREALWTKNAPHYEAE
jgi:hypothetical protein